MNPAFLVGLLHLADETVYAAESQDSALFTESRKPVAMTRCQPALLAHATFKFSRACNRSRAVLSIRKSRSIYLLPLKGICKFECRSVDGLRQRLRALGALRNSFV